MELRTNTSTHYLGLISDVTNMIMDENTNYKKLNITINHKSYMSLTGHDIIVKNGDIIIYMNY